MQNFIIIWILFFGSVAVFLLARRTLRLAVSVEGQNFICSGAALKYLPTRYLVGFVTARDKIARRASDAWLEHKFSYERVLFFKHLSLLGALGVTVLLLASTPIDQALFFGALLISLGLFWPELYLARRAVFAKRAAEKELPIVIDMLQLHMLAGKNLSAAMQAVAENSHGIWGAEFGAVTRRLAYGLPFEAAIEQSIARLKIIEFTHCVAAIRQAEQLGMSLSNTLALQATLLRAKRKRAAETRARAAAVKIGVPLVLCIFPALLIVYLVPAILRVFMTL